ncbi:molecular chaperone HtpG [Ruminococcus albus]|uniref:Chaperone protein HtpG n=1 Tax=Ruminococcus albus (strain ATCC 27210 / DSM 20455 / JCM 14654 / NCDO 2250 / 7) TaxID=697329 RepID=E6UGM4_RUMA7|nr:molecular chaperone HtpG [Ruminococcus albus]ADU23147.1 Heat shock protein Hsp90-like protein [Ruminococcus albus 7 = DSM 20455]
METKQFKAESKRLLDMMINSIYTHKEIFLREIISNASDAIDKLYFKSLTDTSVGLNKDDFAIQIKADKEAKTLTVEDNGIGMTEEELENNLGTIAQSGSLAFKTDNDLGEDVDIIGQFGVGFYSTFMVAKEVRVLTKAYGSDKAFLWKSNGVDGYTIEPAEKETAGTVITMVLKEDTEDEKYSEYCETWRIQQLVKKYSDYIRFPIKMDVEHSNYAEEGEEPTTTIETETLNSMTPIWKKNKSELTDEDYNKFYSEKFMDYQEPIAHIHSKNEGIATYDALLYIPSKAPFDYYSKDYEKGLQLFSSGVLIMDKCADLLPDWFSFVKGVVDSEDLSLNISREMLQQDRQVKIIAKNVEKSIKNELAKLLKNDREKYEKFFEVFGLQFKFGIYQSYGAAIDTLKDLLLFKSTFEDGKSVTLKEYVSRMKEDQKYIYYACGETKERIDKLPQIEKIKDMGYEVLYMTQDVDDFCLKVMLNYDGKTFKSISDADVDLDTEEEKEEVKKLDEENKDMFAFMQETIADKVNKVRLSKKLKSHPVCLSSDGGMISIEMEKVLNAMPQNDANRVKADKALEINPNHEIFGRLQKLYAEDKDTLKDYTKLLYDQALLIEGLSIDDPVEFANLVCKLMVQ